MNFRFPVYLPKIYLRCRRGTDLTVFESSYISINVWPSTLESGGIPFTAGLYFASSL